MECAGCKRKISEQYALSALGRFFHDDCLRCSCCNGPLAEMSGIFYHRDRLLLCLRDYMRLYGRWGECSECAAQVAPFEWVLRANQRVYHLDCFGCAECAVRFCVGDQCYVVEGKVYCARDYARRFWEETTAAQ